MFLRMFCLFSQLYNCSHHIRTYEALYRFDKVFDRVFFQGFNRYP